MNNQMPMGMMPMPMNPNTTCHCREELRALNTRINNLERQVRNLERRWWNSFSNSSTPFATSSGDGSQFQSDNYML